MTGIDIFLLFLVVIPFTIVLIAVALIRHNLVRQARLQAQNILNQRNVECLNCGNEQMTWGVVSSQSFVQFLPFAGVRPGKIVIVYCCDNCGYLMFFTEATQMVKQKRQITELKIS